jgi:peptidyl-prolyl cis-trans isomerase SurA
MKTTVRSAVLLGCCALLPLLAQAAAPRTADYIAAVVNQELVTAFEVTQRMARVREVAQRNNQPLPADAELRRMALEALIEDRAMLSFARESGVRVDDADIDRAVANIAAQNQMTLARLREALAREGLDLARFRANLRDQLLIERVREREVAQRIRITDSEIDDFIATQRGGAGEIQYNVAQILVKVPEDASPAIVAERRARAEAALARVQGGEDFAAVVKEVSEDDNRAHGGEIGLKPASRLPDVFLEVVRPLRAGAVAPALLRSGAGFHILKLVARNEGQATHVTQTHARHILLRPSPQLSEQAVQARLLDFKRQIDSGSRRFEDLAREHSTDGSAAAGGDLGWAAPGQFVPEFEEAMGRLPIGGVSDPVVSRFGIHLIQVLERRDVAIDSKQLREQARNALRERKFEAAYNDWVRELRDRAYVELREAPR